MPSVPKPFLMGQGQNRHPAHGTTLGSGDPQCSQESAASESESGFTLSSSSSSSSSSAYSLGSSSSPSAASPAAALTLPAIRTSPVSPLHPRLSTRKRGLSGDRRRARATIPPRSSYRRNLCQYRRRRPHADPPLLHRQVSLTVVRGVPSSNRGTPTCQLIDRAPIDRAMLGVFSQ